jgi:L-asparaginase
MSNRGKIALVLAGGQIGMKFNPQTNTCQPNVTADEMLSWVPVEISEKIFVVDWSRQPSSHYTIRMSWPTGPLSGAEKAFLRWHAVSVISDAAKS